MKRQQTDYFRSQLSEIYEEIQHQNDYLDHNSMNFMKTFNSKQIYLDDPVLRIQLILIRIQVISLKFIFCLIFFAYLYAKTCWTIHKSRHFYNLSFFNSSDFGFEIKIFFVAVFGWYFAPWIRIQEAKILRILSTVIRSQFNEIYVKIQQQTDIFRL